MLSRCLQSGLQQELKAVPLRDSSSKLLQIHFPNIWKKKQLWSNLFLIHHNYRNAVLETPPQRWGFRGKEGWEVAPAQDVASDLGMFRRHPQALQCSGSGRPGSVWLNVPWLKRWVTGEHGKLPMSPALPEPLLCAVALRSSIWLQAKYTHRKRWHLKQANAATLCLSCPQTGGKYYACAMCFCAMWWHLSICQVPSSVILISEELNSHSCKTPACSSNLSFSLMQQEVCSLPWQMGHFCNDKKHQLVFLAGLISKIGF